MTRNICSLYVLSCSLLAVSKSDGERVGEYDLRLPAAVVFRGDRGPYGGQVATPPQGRRVDHTGVAFQDSEQGDDADQRAADFAAGDAAPLRDKVRRCLSVYFHNPESAASRSPWAVMHWSLAFGVDTEIQAHSQRVNAIGWLCWNGSCRGQQLFQANNGQPVPRQGPGVQGHEGQFLSMLAQCRVSKDYEIRVEGSRFTVEDLVEYEKKTCRPRSELSFKLIGLSHYLQSDETWNSDSGEEWSIPRLVKEELAQPVIGSTCGGTHRLMGLSYAVHKRRQRGEAIEGQWERAAKYVDAYIDYAFKLQNPDGSLSTEWLAGRGDRPDGARRLETSGHILEWLVFALPDERLTDPNVAKSVHYLADLMLERRAASSEIGAVGHALHALALYDERVFGGKPGMRAATLVKAEKKQLEE